ESINGYLFVRNVLISNRVLCMSSVIPPGLSASDLQLERRAAIKQIAVLCGLALSTSSLSLMADSFSSPRGFSRRKERLFNAEQLALVRELGELIIPATDTPGAIGAEVHHFIDHQAACCLSAQEQESLIKGLQRINSTAERSEERRVGQGGTTGC